MKNENFNYENIKINEEELSITKIGEITTKEEESSIFILLLFGIIMVFIFCLPLIVSLMESLPGLFGLYYTLFRFYNKFSIYAEINVISKMVNFGSDFVLGLLSGFKINGLLGFFSNLFHYGFAIVMALFICLLTSIILKLKK